MFDNFALVPSWEDSESLPQVHAYVLEALRWRPILSMGECFLRIWGHQIDCTYLTIGFAHRATQDIVWVCHLALDHKTFVEPKDITERSMHSGGCDCHWLSLVNMLFPIRSCKTDTLITQGYIPGPCGLP